MPEGKIHSSRSLGNHKTTAQVHPGLFTKFFADQFVQKSDTSIVMGQATSMTLDNGVVSSVTVSTSKGEEVIPADAVVIAAGPWTGELAKKLLGNKVGGMLGVQGHRAHSIVLKTKEELSAHCLFTSMSMEDGSQGEPEIYTRPDGTTYM